MLIKKCLMSAKVPYQEVFTWIDSLQCPLSPRKLFISNSRETIVQKSLKWGPFGEERPTEWKLFKWYLRQKKRICGFVFYVFKSTKFVYAFIFLKKKLTHSRDKNVPWHIWLKGCQVRNMRSSSTSLYVFFHYCFHYIKGSQKLSIGYIS